MDTVALRFSENFATENGTIFEHNELIKKNGFVWYGKFGLPISLKTKELVLNNDKAKVLLIQSGKTKRFWAYISDIAFEEPPKEEYPSYYHNSAEKVKTWLKVIRFEEADNDIMRKCYVKSSKVPLSDASKHSMSPYFIIECEV